jgi:hypothetical protein
MFSPFFSFLPALVCTEEELCDPVYVPSPCLPFSPPPIYRPLAIDILPAVIYGEPSEKQESSAPASCIGASTMMSDTSKDDANELHIIPVESEVTRLLAPGDITTSRLAPYLATAMTSTTRDAFIREQLPTRVQIALDQPFGKDSLSQSFYSEVNFRHTIPYLYNLGWLSKRDRSALEAALPVAKRYAILWKQHRDVDFRPARGFWDNWQDNTVLDGERKKMITACFIHFLCDTPTVVRYLGGAYVSAHRDTEAILSKLQPIIDPVTFALLARAYRMGAPTLCNANATDENLWHAIHYGNHKSTDAEPQKTRKSVIKDCRRGYALCMSMLLLPYIPHTHVTALGMVDLEKRFKTPRPVFDSTFRPEDWSFAINDWTSKSTEPPVTFAPAFVHFLIWVWNMRISYPHLELYPHDNDMTSGFRHVKYHPNLVGMHAYLVYGILLMATGQTFGDTGSPGNFNAIPVARQQVAQYFWHLHNIIERAAEYTPYFELAPSPTPSEIAQFVRANPDSHNQGVFAVDGSRLAPTFDHHVDDLMSAEIGELLPRTISASVLSLYEVLGYPNKYTPDPLSRDKFVASHTHRRKLVGWIVDTRRMIVELPDYKRERVVVILSEWIAAEKFTLKGAAELHGIMNDMSYAHRWGKTYFVILQQTLRDTLKIRYWQVVAYYKRKKTEPRLAKPLPANLQHRVDALVAREQSRILWHPKHKMFVSDRLRAELQILHQYLEDRANDWSISIGHLIPRDHQFEFTGDASQQAGGAYSHELRLWWDTVWPQRYYAACKLKSKDPGYLHINLLEFVVVIISVAAATTWLEDAQSSSVSHRDLQIPAIPVGKLMTDNNSVRSWVHKVCSRSEIGQRLVQVYAEMLPRSECAFPIGHIPGKDNLLADFISRPENTNLPLPLRHEQIFHFDVRTKSYDYFQVNPELLSLLDCALFSEEWVGQPQLPRQLGRIVRAGHTTSYSSWP